MSSECVTTNASVVSGEIKSQSRDQSLLWSLYTRCVKLAMTVVMVLPGILLSSECLCSARMSSSEGLQPLVTDMTVVGRLTPSISLGLIAVASGRKITGLVYLLTSVLVWQAIVFELFPVDRRMALLSYISMLRLFQDLAALLVSSSLYVTCLVTRWVEDMRTGTGRSSPDLLALLGFYSVEGSAKEVHQRFARTAVVQVVPIEEDATAKLAKCLDAALKREDSFSVVKLNGESIRPGYSPQPISSNPTIAKMASTTVAVCNKDDVHVGFAALVKTPGELNRFRLVTLQHVISDALQGGETCYLMSLTARPDGSRNRMVFAPTKSLLRSTELIMFGKKEMRLEFKVPANAQSVLGLRASAYSETVKTGAWATVFIPPDKTGGEYRYSHASLAVCGGGKLLFAGSTTPGSSGSPYLASGYMVGIHVGSTTGGMEKNVGFYNFPRHKPPDAGRFAHFLSSVKSSVAKLTPESAWVDSKPWKEYDPSENLEGSEEFHDQDRENGRNTVYRGNDYGFSVSRSARERDEEELAAVRERDAKAEMDAKAKGKRRWGDYEDEDDRPSNVKEATQDDWEAQNDRSRPKGIGKMGSVMIRPESSKTQDFGNGEQSSPEAAPVPGICVTRGKKQGSPLEGSSSTSLSGTPSQRRVSFQMKTTAQPTPEPLGGKPSKSSRRKRKKTPSTNGGVNESVESSADMRPRTASHMPSHAELIQLWRDTHGLPDPSPRS